jgi:two-component system response regulator YesN
MAGGPGTELDFEEAHLHKLILQQDNKASLGYLENLFAGQVNQENSVDAILGMCMKIAIFLQGFKREYHLENHEHMQNLMVMMEEVYQAEDIFTLCAIFLTEVTEIIRCLNQGDSQVTPVVRQILGEVHKNYKEDMNLKTLAYKYHMNTAYLGQIFQKEVGCSFSQYLSNFKNSKARELILNTNMRISDIASAVGYVDSSYFFRKFKQCYGVSPAALRSMKQYR